MLDEVFMKHMRNRFRIKDEGEIERFLGMDLKKDGDTLVTSQERYIEQVLKRFNITRPKTSPVTEHPMDKLSKRHEKRFGSLRYVADGSRWDIQYAAGRAASDVTGEIETQTIQHLLVTKGEFLTFRRDPLLRKCINIFARVDASFKQRPDCDTYYGFNIYANNCVWSHRGLLREVSRNSCTKRHGCGIYCSK